MTSCPTESTCSAYLDGELPPQDARALEAHLIACQACRARLLALREEAELLGDVLLERERRPLARRPAAAAARGLAIGAAPAVAAVTVVATVLGWILGASPSPSVAWLNPLRLTGASEMVFDLIFALRDEAPDLLALAVAVAALASVSAVLTFAVTLILRRWSAPGALAVAAVALLGAPSPSEAHFGLHRHEDFALAAGETHEGTLLLSGSNVDIDGTVRGDVIAAARRLTVRGKVQGNVYAFARTVELAGTVEGSVHAFSHGTLVSGDVRSDLYAFTEQFTLAPRGRIGRNASLVAEEAVVEGSVGRDLFTAGNWTDVRGTIAGNLESWHSRLNLRETARVGGDVEAVLHSEADLQVSPGAVVAGQTRTRLAERAREHRLARYRHATFYLLLGLGFAAALLVGMLAHAVLPAIFEERLETAGSFFGALGLGFLALVATPVALCLAAVTLVGIPLAVIGAAVYLIALYLSGIVVAALVGSAVLRSEPGGASSFFLTLLVGLLIVIVVGHLPFVAIPVHAVVILTGLGLLVRRARSLWAARRAAALTPPA